MSPARACLRRRQPRPGRRGSRSRGFLQLHCPDCTPSTRPRRGRSWRKVCEYAIAARLHDVCARGSRVHGCYLADCWLQLPTALTRRTTGGRKVMRKRLINLVCLYWYRSDNLERPDPQTIEARHFEANEEPSTRSTRRTPRRRRVLIAPGASVNSSTKGCAWCPRNDGAVAREMTSVRPAPRS